MEMIFDFIIVGAGSAGAALAARLSEDPKFTVALIEAGGPPPAHEQMPAACAALQLDPEVDWMFSGDSGKGGLGFHDRRMPVPRGKMLGGSSAINYMVWVRGHPGDFDNWENLGADGWSHADVLPCFKRMEEVAETNEASIDREQRGDSGPVGVAIRSPVIPASRGFVEAAVAAGIPEGDYNGSGRFDPNGVASLVQTNTRKGRRSSTFHAYLENSADQRDNLTIITDALVTRLILEGEGESMTATGVEYRDVAGNLQTLKATKEIILSAGAVGSPHILMLSGIGSRRELEAVGVDCLLDQPHVGKHLKDHLYTPLVFEAAGLGVAVDEINLSVGPDAIRAPAGPLPADARDDDGMPAELVALKAEAEQRLTEWTETGSSLVASSFYDSICFFSTGLGDAHTHDGQIGFLPMVNTAEVLSKVINYDLDQILENPRETLATNRAGLSLLASNCVPRSEGEIILGSADPAVSPEINFNYFSDPHDLKVMVAIIRRALDIVDHWPGPVKPGRWLVPPGLARQHGYEEGEPPSDAFLENMALHFGTTIYHLSCTCRIGDVVDPRLRVFGVKNLRIADASVMPEIPSGNTNAPSIMIGERAADLIGEDHQMTLSSIAA